ncbi:MAG: choice-of-anchor D domain-containing protein, partial [Myxococcota bacterium]|nr:choice-of-anchor D domain-containing protein [Myxococcota bacterium]
MTVLAAFALAAYGCGDDTSGGGGSGSGGQGIGGGEEPKIEVTEGGVNANADDFVLTVSLSGFCSPETDEGCDLDDPSNNEKLAGSLKIINTGGAALQISEISVTSPTDAFRLEAQAPLELPKGGDSLAIFPNTGSDNPRTLWVDVYVLRQEEGAEAPSATITIKSNSQINQAEVINIAVETGGLLPEITVDPNAIDFGNVGADEIATKQLFVINSGLGTLELSGFVLSGHPAFAFSYGGKEWPVSAETQSQGITFDEVIEVEPGEAIQAMVRFQPEGPEPAQANLVLLSNDPTQAGGTLVKISGNQSGPCITINPKKVDFGGKLIGKVATVDVEILSCGESPVRLRSISMEQYEGTVDFGLDLGNLPGLDPGMASLEVLEDSCSIDSDCAAGLVCDNGSCAVEIGINQTATFQVTFIPDEENPKDENGQPVPDL